MKVLSIETSCDETAVAVVESSGGLKKPRFKILKNLVASQIKIHRPFGGVVPNLAKREHNKNLPILFRKLKAKNCKLKADLIAVTIGPGLEPCLWEGINFAKNIKNQILNVKIIGVSHLSGHLYSFLLNPKSYRLKAKSRDLFPAIALIVSGGHTILLLMENLVDYKKIGETRDDAAGEAFDKVARLLDLPYPGGPEIEKIAKIGNPAKINFPRPMIFQKNYDFSFSGLKTAVLYYLRAVSLKAKSYKLKANIAASFQQAAIDVLTAKTFRAAEDFKAKSILLSGGVAGNKTLRRNFQKEARKKRIKFFVPSLKFTTDNAAMIAAAGYLSYLNGKKLRLVAQAGLEL